MVAIVVLAPQEISPVIVVGSDSSTSNLSGNGWMSQGTWLFVHGMGSHPSVFGWVESFMQLDEGVPKSNMMAPQLPNYEPLGNWTNNLVMWMNQSGMMSLPDGSVKVVAHSFGTAVTLFLLRTAYALQHGNATQLASAISSKCTDFPAVQGNSSARVACYEIVTEIQTQAKNPSLWIEAANKIGAVYLYHGAIRGGCCACTGVFATPQTAASVCVLGQVNSLLWYPISDLTWDGAKPIVDIYGFAGGNHQCSGLCSGNVTQDKEVTEEDQRLLFSVDGDTGTAVSGSYTEVFGGYYCHSDFSSNIDGAAEAMVHTIAAHPPSTITTMQPVSSQTVTTASFSAYAIYLSSHPDDWILIEAPSVIRDATTSTTLTIVITITAGDKGYKDGWWQDREEAATAALQSLTANTLTSQTITVNGHQIAAKVSQSLIGVFVRIPDGAGLNTTLCGVPTATMIYGTPNYGCENLEQLHASNKPVTTVDGATTYTSWADLVTTVHQILNYYHVPANHLTTINAQDWNQTTNPGDHPDHYQDGYIAQALESYSYGMFRFFEGYRVKSLPSNLAVADVNVKTKLWDIYNNQVAALYGYDLDCKPYGASTGNPTACSGFSYFLEEQYYRTGS